MSPDHSAQTVALNAEYKCGAREISAIDAQSSGDGVPLDFKEGTNSFRRFGISGVAGLAYVFR